MDAWRTKKQELMLGLHVADIGANASSKCFPYIGGLQGL